MRFLEQGKEYVVSLYRIVIGLLFVSHGAGTLFGAFGAKQAAAFGAWPGWWAAAIQLVAGGLVLVGLFTRVAALLCSGSMAYAYFTVHMPKSLFPILNGGEASVQFCWAFLLVAFLGPGIWSIDHVLRRSAAVRVSADPQPATR
ncbi:DoxX family protein [Kutzneria buriramensis]|uniref:Putative oxidoreductase n=1 Tax=Kutzneria buriramensis TaxID=1045776 RepID=A0A3E0HZI4_9PSEU|nr:DoxX family protein [Kutzneria buriramensis]REH51791.1 putative oxidoreductase [Kutzneria buriramensis]